MLFSVWWCSSLIRHKHVFKRFYLTEHPLGKWASISAGYFTSPLLKENDTLRASCLMLLSLSSSQWCLEYKHPFCLAQWHQTALRTHPSPQTLQKTYRNLYFFTCFPAVPFSPSITAAQPADPHRRQRGLLPALLTAALREVEPYPLHGPHPFLQLLCLI